MQVAQKKNLHVTINFAGRLAHWLAGGNGEDRANVLSCRLAPKTCLVSLTGTSGVHRAEVTETFYETAALGLSLLSEDMASRPARR